jgi:hypothetical protein
LVAPGAVRARELVAREACARFRGAAAVGEGALATGADPAADVDVRLVGVDFGACLARGSRAASA